jgi:hypothetical protein
VASAVEVRRGEEGLWCRSILILCCIVVVVVVVVVVLYSKYGDSDAAETTGPGELELRHFVHLPSAKVSKTICYMTSSVLNS